MAWFPSSCKLRLRPVTRKSQFGHFHHTYDHCTPCELKKRDLLLNVSRPQQLRTQTQPNPDSTPTQPIPTPTPTPTSIMIVLQKEHYSQPNPTQPILNRVVLPTYPLICSEVHLVVFLTVLTSPDDFAKSHVQGLPEGCITIKKLQCTIVVNK